MVYLRPKLDIVKLLDTKAVPPKQVAAITKETGAINYPRSRASITIEFLSEMPDRIEEMTPGPESVDEVVNDLLSDERLPPDVPPIEFLLDDSDGTFAYVATVDGQPD